MAKREPWILVLVAPGVKRHSPVWALGRYLGTTTAVQWAREARTMTPSGLRRKLREHQN